MPKLMKCKSCGNMIAKSASFCPQCGGKVDRSNGLAILFLIVLAVAIFTSCLRGMYQDAPELDQPWGDVSKAALIALTHRRQLNIEPKGDSWGRLVGVARRGREIDVGLELIKMGLAWHDPRYAPKAKEYAEAEAEARKAKRGLWSDDKPVAPWDWRKQQNDDIDEDD